MENKLQITIEKTTALDSIPSGSGLFLHKDSLYIISDNSPSFYKLDIATKGYRTLSIDGYSPVEYVLPKKTKHDLECAAGASIAGKDCLLAFGSGSTPLRETLLIAETGNDTAIRQIPLTEFYAVLRKRYDLPDEALNIEGAATCAGRLYLFLRKKNMVISMKLSEFTGYISAPQQTPVPQSEQQAIILPKHSGIFAGFSGATEIIYDKKEALLFCASLERTPNSIDDGPVFGSYIGLLTRNENGDLKPEAITLVKDGQGNILKHKIESLVVTNYGMDGHYTVLLISDNDDGVSTLFEATVTIREQ